jgi:hypothetical protein
MDELLNAIETSEYTDGIEGLLSGVVSDEELLGAFKRNPKRMRRIFSRKGNPSSGASSGSVASSSVAVASRAEFMERFNQLSPELKKGLLSKDLQLVETEFYVSKSISQKTLIKMLEDDDKKVVGKSNISGAKLEKNEVFLLSGLVILSGVGGGVTDNDLFTTDFGIIDKVIRNGEFEFKANGKTLVPKMSTQVFATHMFREHISTAAPDTSYGFAYGADQRIGFMKLANPKLIESQMSMELNVEWGAPAPLNSFLKLILCGSRIAKH